MVYIDREHACLLELLKSALFDMTPIIPESVNWNKIFESAKAQCIVPLLATSIPLEYREEWNRICFQSKAHFMQMIFEQNTLVRLFRDNNIPLVILKGTAAAIYYPNPILRTFGDIDFYICKEFLERARYLLEQNEYTFELKNERHYEYTKHGIEFELHTRFSCDYYNDIDPILLLGMNNSIDYKIINYSFPGLPAKENGIVLLGHIMQHLNDSGIGLRQIVDWMMFVHKELDDSAWEKSFKQLAIDAGLDELAITVTYMCKKWLGLPDEITWCNLADEKVADNLIIRVLDDGNFGQDRAPYESVKKLIQNEGIFKYLQRAGMENWALAQSHKLLRPFAWLYQLCRFTHKGVVGLIKGKKVFKKDKQKNVDKVLK